RVASFIAILLNAGCMKMDTQMDHANLRSIIDPETGECRSMKASTGMALLSAESERLAKRLCAPAVEGAARLKKQVTGAGEAPVTLRNVQDMGGTDRSVYGDSLPTRSPPMRQFIGWLLACGQLQTCGLETAHGAERRQLGLACQVNRIGQHARGLLRAVESGAVLRGDEVPAHLRFPV